MGKMVEQKKKKKKGGLNLWFVALLPYFSAFPLCAFACFSFLKNKRKICLMKKKKKKKKPVINK